MPEKYVPWLHWNYSDTYFRREFLSNRLARYYGPLEKKTGEKLLIRIGVFCKALVAFAMVLTSGFVSVLVVIGLFAVSSAITVPTLNASISKTANQHKGTLIGFASTAGNLSKVVAPLLAGYLLYLDKIELAILQVFRFHHTTLKV